MTNVSWGYNVALQCQHSHFCDTCASLFRWRERSSATWTTSVIWIVARFTPWCVTCAMSSTSHRVCWIATTSFVPAAYVAGPMTAASVAPSVGKTYEHASIHHLLCLLSPVKGSHGITVKSLWPNFTNSNRAVWSKFLKKKTSLVCSVCRISKTSISCRWYYKQII